MNNFFKIALYILLITLIMSSCAIDKGFESLNNYNYFDAKQKFERLEKRKIVPSSYGLSVIYQRNDNPFYNLDSALIKINKAYYNYSSLSDNKKEKYQKYEIDSLSILKQRSLISTLYFNRAVETNSVYGFQEFISKNKWSPNVDIAINLRDSLFFFENHEKGGAADYELFMIAYPNSIYYTKADKLYQKAFYKENTVNNTIADYKKYLSEKPNGDFVTEAQNCVFSLSITNKSIAEYSSFITSYPENRNVNTAWLLLYDGYMQNNYSIDAINQFIGKYPNFPFKRRLKDELLMVNIEFYKYKVDNKWGFVSKDGMYFIDTKYDYVEDFSEGLAVVNSDGKTGYITKTGDVKIVPEFDDGYSFKNGFAVVEVNELFGLINRSGEFIIEPIYDDLGNVNDGLLSFEKDEKMGFFNTNGKMTILPQYSDVSNFSNNLAIVNKDSKVGVIDTNGNPIIDFVYTKIKMIDANHFAVKNDTSWGVINLLKEVILPFEFDYIELDHDSLLLVEKNTQFNYWDFSRQQFITEVWFETYSEYKVLAMFNTGFAKVKTSNGYNFIDTAAKFVFENFYINLGMYNNYISFETEKGWGYLNLKGEVTVKPSYTKTNSFSKSGGVVEIDDNKGVVDEKGEIILPIYFEELRLLNDTLIIVEKNNQYGVLSNFNDTIVSLQYNFIEPISNSIVKIGSETELMYYNYSNQTWLKKEEE